MFVLSIFNQVLIIILFITNTAVHAEVIKIMTVKQANATNNTTKLNFANPLHFTNVATISDIVMGGRSSGGFTLSDDKTDIIFFGDLSLENNGGFSSIEFSLINHLPNIDYKRLCLKAVLDGRLYQLRLKTADTPNGVAYAAEFSSEKNNCFNFVLSDFKPRYRGRAVLGIAPLRFADITQASIMLADKTAAPFMIKLQSIELN